MAKIQTTDNSSKTLDCFAETLSDLQNIANITLKEAQEKNPGLLIFPQHLGEHGDDIGKGHICEIQGQILKTGNVMGFVGYGSTELTISSRFAQDETDCFLHYMLQKVFCPNLFEWKHSYNVTNIFDFLLYLFPYYLNNALTQGLFKEYRRFERNDNKVKGTIDVSRHIRLNIPFAGKIAYNTREYSYDNCITQLIRHTIEYIKCSELGQNILSEKETRENVRLIIDNTPTYSKNDLYKVLADNVKEVCHPYFTEYTILQKICMQILHHEGLKYGENEDKVYGILFDGAWLWEEYLAKILTDFEHPQNRRGKNPIWLFDSQKDDEGKIFTHKHCKRYPDFYRKATEKSNAIILDAKYKRLNSGVISRDDMHQIIAYMHVEQAMHGGLIYPLESNKEDLNKNIKADYLGKLRGFGGEVWTYGFPIAYTDSYADFCTQMKVQENKLFELFKMYENIVGTH